MTYPNVLLMGYLKETRQLTPEWQMKLEQAISQGYQRLLTFEVKGGGFEWYGRAPANVILTAYGILEFTDMAKVHPVDPAVVDRAIAWLESQQQSDGSWRAERWHDADPAAVTAYVAWALRQAGRPNAKAEAFLRGGDDPYTQALVANATGKPADLKSWASGRAGLFHSSGKWLEVETAALAALASPSDEALKFIARSKDPNGSWGSTQATILSLKALLQGGKARPPESPVALRLRVNGRELSMDTITKANYDVLQSVDVTPHVVEGENVVEIEGDLEAGVQVAGRYYLPWELVPAVESPLDLRVTYDRAELGLGDTLRARAELAYKGKGTFMVIVDLGIPPGFDADAGAFEKLVAAKVIDKYALAGRQVTLYFGRLSEGQRVAFEFTMRPRFPVRASAPPSGTYEYYSPDRPASARPLRVAVAGN